MAARTPTFRFRSRSLVRGASAVVAIAVLVVAVAVRNGDTVLLVVGLLLLAVSTWAAVRTRRTRLTISDGRLRLHGMWRTRSVELDQVRSVSMRSAGTLVIGWQALELVLADGERVRCFGLTAPTTRPERLVPVLDWIDQRLPHNRM